MKIQVFPDADLVALAAASAVAEAARAAAAERGRFVMAVSGGTTPWQMLKALAHEVVPWPAVHIFQVDERVAPPGDPDRNLTHLLESLLSHAPLEESQIHAMPVNDPDLPAAAARYATTLLGVAGMPAVFDLIHLGLGPDGHTASLVPGDPVLEVSDFDVALTGVYQNRRRMTLTYPVLNRARAILWVVTGASKADPLVRLINSDPTIPAGRVNRARANLLADEAAAAKLEALP
jgi:6-phosphogluconolactonase